MSDIFASINRLLFIRAKLAINSTANFKRSYLLGEGAWGRNSKKIYNQIGYEESFEHGFGKIGGGGIKLIVFLVSQFVVKLTSNTINLPHKKFFYHPQNHS
jgi:hypothetical protein